MLRHPSSPVRRLLFVAVAALVLLAGAPAGAKSSKLRLERLRFDRLPDLTAYLTYAKGDGSVVSGLAASDFKILVDSAELGGGQRAVPFAETGEPVFLVGVVQLSPPVEPILEEVRRGLRGLEAAVQGFPGGHMDLIGYASEVKRLCEGCSAAQLGSTIDKLAIDPEGAEVRMIEALQVAIDLLRAQPTGGRKIIALVSDGIDVNNEMKAFTNVAQRAERAGIVIDTIGYAPFEAGKLRSLGELVLRSYGIERVAKAPAEIGPCIGALSEELRRQYVVTFPLPLAADGKEHTFQVISETGDGSAISQIVSRPLALGPAPPELRRAQMPRRAPRWLWGLGVVPLAGLVYLLWRRRTVTHSQSVPASLPAQPLLPSMRSPMEAMRTIVLQQGGEVVLGWLTGLSGPAKGRDYKLGRRIVIGSSADCDIVIADSMVSACHCEVRQTPEGFKIIDLGSTNGLVVNDHRTREHILIDNDVFRVGRVEFKFKAI